jgi:hypothetical protein
MDALLFLLIFAGFLSTGRIFTRNIWNLDFSGSAEAFVFSSALGSVITSMIVAGLAFTGQVTPLTCWAVLAILLLSIISQRSALKGLKTTLTSKVFFPISLLKTSVQIILAILILLALSLALAPAFATDALVYHLAVPKAFLEAGGLINLPNNVFSFYPQHMEMLYLFALALGTDHLAQLTGLGIVFLLLIALHQNYKLKGSPKYALLVPAIFLSTPAFFTVAYSAYVDLQTATYLFLSFYAWENWRDRKQIGWFYLMVIFVGTALATKLTAIIALPLALLGIALQGKKDSKKALSQCLILVLGVSLFILPWWGKNYIFTGNPFAPFFMQIFGGEQGMNWDINRSLQHFQYFTSYGMGHGILDFLLLPINLTFFSQPHSLKFDGQIGILYFLLLPALFGLRRQSISMVILFSVFMVFWFTQTQQARLLATPFTFLAILSVKGLEGWFSSLPGGGGTKEKIFLLAVLLLGLVFNTSLIVKVWAKIQPMPYIFQKENREPFLMRQIKSYPVYLSANHLVEQDEKVLLVFMRNFGFLMNRPFFSDSVFEAHTLTKIIDEEVYAEAIIEKLKSMGITHIMFNYHFVLGEDSALNTGEKGIFKNFLIRHGEQVFRKNEFFLYRFVLDLGPENPDFIPIPLNHSGSLQEE